LVKGEITVSSKNRFDKLKQLIEEIQKIEVYVGITEEKAPRKTDPVSNAQLAFLHTRGVRSSSMRSEMEGYAATQYSAAHEMYLQAHGSPLWNIQPRPIIEPAISASRGPIGDELAQAAKAAMNGNPGETMTHLKRAGIIAQNACRAWFMNPNNQWAPNAPSTIARKGSDQPLINTGQLRRAITYVVKTGERVEGGDAGD